MNSVQFTDPLPAAAVSQHKECAFYAWASSVLRIRIIRLRSPAEMRKLLNRKIVEQNRICPICLEEFTDYNDVVPDHKEPKGMGGAWRDDHPDNIQATHWWCNEEKLRIQRTPLYTFSSVTVA